MKKNKIVREFVDSEFKAEEGYEDILELSRACKYSNCTHITEEDCAVQGAIEEGNLSEERFNAFFKDKNEAEYVSKQKNKTKAIEYMKQRDLFKRS
jgi:putative ribosome biogenesis GTPase RsgA